MLQRLGLLGFVILTLSLLPLVQAQPQPLEDDCLAYAFTKSDQHSFLLENYSIAYGDQIFIRTNCDQFTVYFDNVFHSNYTDQKEIMIPYSSNSINLTIESGNYSYFAYKVVRFDNEFSWSSEYVQYIENQPSLIEVGALTFQENVVSVGSIVIVWFLSVNIYWALINHYLDRNLFEEVVE